MSRGLLAALWPSQSVAAAELDSGGAIVAANPALDRLAGGSASGRALADLGSPGQRDAIDRLVREARDGWESISAGLAPDVYGVPSDYRLWARRDGEQVLVVAEPHHEDLARLNAQLLELNDELIRARRDLARAAAAERRTAVALQEGLLPELPEIGGMELAARYRAAFEGHLVGGDFFDVLDLGESGIGVLVGDVRGKGPEAAAVTALARFTARAVAKRTRRPSAVLAAIHEAIREQPERRRRHCSAAYAWITRDGARARMWIASGGHPLPLLVRAGGGVAQVGAPGTLLGLEPRLDIEDRDAELAPGDTLLLYTDGVSDARSGRDVLGDGRLAELAAAHAPGGVDELADAVQRAALEFTGGRLRDDLALVAARLR